MTEAVALLADNALGLIVGMLIGFAIGHAHGVAVERADWIERLTVRLDRVTRRS